MYNRGSNRPHSVRGRQRQSWYRSSDGSSQSQRPAQTVPPRSPSTGALVPVASGDTYPLQPTANPAPTELRLVLLGRTGAGKSATGNTIFGQECFNAELSMSSVTQQCKRERGSVEGRNVVLVDTPGLFDTDLALEDLREEVIHCVSLCTPGPHAFLLVIPIERYTEEQQHTVTLIQDMFQDISSHVIIIFSHADKLRGTSIETFISRQKNKIQDLVEKFGRRFLGFDNTKPENREQVTQLLAKVDELLAQNENRHFSNQITEVVARAQGIIEEKREAALAEKIKKIKVEVKKMANARLDMFTADMNEERQETERRRRRIQSRIDQIKMDIEKEEQHAQPIEARLMRFRTTLQNEQQNLQSLEEREMKEERKRQKRARQEKVDMDLWIQEEEQRREKEEREKTEDYSHYIKMLIWLSLFLLGFGAGFAPTLLGFLFPAAPVVEAGLSAEFLASLLGWGAAEGAAGGLFWGAAGFGIKAAAVKLAVLTRCSIQ